MARKRWDAYVQKTKKGGEKIIQEQERNPEPIKLIAKEMELKYPKLPESEIVGSDAWKNKVRAELFYQSLTQLRGVEKY